MANRKIFISATSRDLGSYRALASKTLRSRGYITDDQEIFNLTHLEIHTKLEKRIADCGAVVCLIGFVFGGEPSGRPESEPRRSYTQLEYDIARRLGLPVFLLFADEATRFDPHDNVESEDLRQLQLNYIAEVKRNKDWLPFTSKEQLRTEIALLQIPWSPTPHDKPNNLPFATIGTLFKGRESFLADLRNRLTTPDGKAAAIVARQAVHGLGGVGKTRAAIEYGWKHAGDYSALLFISAPTAADLRSNLAELVGVLAIDAGPEVDKRLAEVLHWLDAHPGWLLILDNVDTEEAAREAEKLLARLKAGHVLITSRISNWGAGVEPLELHVLAEADAVSFLLERTSNRRKTNDDPASARTIARELEQAGAYLDKLRLTFAEYLARWQAKRPEVLAWHDQRLMKYPVSVAVTWTTTFEQLNEPERLLLGVLSNLAPEPIPLALFDTKPMTDAIDEPRERLAGLAGYSLVRYEDPGDAVLVHRLVQEIGRQKAGGTDENKAVQIALEAVNYLAPFVSYDVRTWPVWTPLAPHALAVTRRSDAAGIMEPTARLMNQLGLYLRVRSQHGEAERLFRRALAIAERSYGPDHPDVARDLNNLALLLQATNRLGEAEPIMRRALAIDERSYGPDHPDVATDLNNLALLLQATNRLGEAEPIMRRALAIDERSYGPDHPNVARDLNNLAQLLQATNRLGEAEPLFRRSVSILRGFRDLTGHEHPGWRTILENYRLLLEDMGLPGEEIDRRIEEVGGD